MRRSRCLGLCLMCLLSVLFITTFGVGTASAKWVKYSFVNYSGRTIKALYITSSGYDKWGKDLLGNSVLYNGNSVSLQYSNEYRYYDVKIVWNDGSDTTWSKVDYKSVWRKTLYLDGSTYYIKSN